jgi:hypothetical protein
VHCTTAATAFKQMLHKEGRASDAQCVKDAEQLFENLIALAEAQPGADNSKFAKFNIGRRLK